MKTHELEAYTEVVKVPDSKGGATDVKVSAFRHPSEPDLAIIVCRGEFIVAFPKGHAWNGGPAMVPQLLFGNLDSAAEALGQVRSVEGMEKWLEISSAGIDAQIDNVTPEKSSEIAAFLLRMSQFADRIGGRIHDDDANIGIAAGAGGTSVIVDTRKIPLASGASIFFCGHPNCGRPHLVLFDDQNRPSFQLVIPDRGDPMTEALLGAISERETKTK